MQLAEFIRSTPLKNLLACAYVTLIIYERRLLLIVATILFIGLIKYLHSALFELSVVERWERDNDSKVIIVNSEIGYGTGVMFKRVFNNIDINKTVDVILHTEGGNFDDAKIIVDVFKNHKGKIRVYVPYDAYSCGTILALAGAELYMSPNAHLSPIDIQTTMGKDKKSIHLPFIYYNKLLERFGEWTSEKMYIDYLYAKSTQDFTDKLYEKLLGKYAEEVRVNIKKHLYGDTFTHDHTFSAAECRDMGIMIHGECPFEVFTIIDSQ